MAQAPHEMIADYTECPDCVEENDAVGGGTGYADRYFNDDGALWAVCVVHQVRWYVTRELFGVNSTERLAHPNPAAARELPIVDGIFRNRR